MGPLPVFILLIYIINIYYLFILFINIYFIKLPLEEIDPFDMICGDDMNQGKSEKPKPAGKVTKKIFLFQTFSGVF